MPTLSAAGRHDLADDEWRVLEPLLPRGRRRDGRRSGQGGSCSTGSGGGPGRGRRGGTSRRSTGRGSRSTGCSAAGSSTAPGASSSALQVLADAAGHVTWDVSVDSGTARAHQHAAGARKDGVAQQEPPGGGGAPEPGDHALGRSRGGRACQIFCVSWGSRCPFVTYCRVVFGAGSDGDAVGECDGECVHCCFPAVSAGSAFSSFADQPVAVDMPAGDIPDPEVKQLYCGLVAGEMAAVLGYLPQLEVNRLDSVSRVDYLPDGGVEFKERDEAVPGPFPGGDHSGAFLPEIAAQVLQGGFRGGLVEGGVDGPHRGGGLLALFPRHVLH